MLRLIASATGLVLFTLLALVAPAGAQQAPALSLSATLGQGHRDGERAMAVTAQGVAPSEGTRLYVHYDQEVEDCPADDPEYELGDGIWVMRSPAGAPFRRLAEGDFVEEEEIFVRRGPARLCGYLVQDDDFGDPQPALVVTGTLATVERDPTIGSIERRSSPRSWPADASPEKCAPGSARARGSTSSTLPDPAGFVSGSSLATAAPTRSSR